LRFIVDGIGEATVETTETLLGWPRIESTWAAVGSCLYSGYMNCTE
jgi:hypothetical protein